MKKFILFMVLASSAPAFATVTCSKTVTGTTYCSGSDRSGREISTESTTTNTGTTFITGHEGGKRVNRECHTTSTGTTYCN